MDFDKHAYFAVFTLESQSLVTDGVHSHIYMPSKGVKNKVKEREVIILFFRFKLLRIWVYHFQELKRERTKAATAVKSLQEKLEEKLRMELEEKVHSFMLTKKFYSIISLLMNSS